MLCCAPFSPGCFASAHRTIGNEISLGSASGLALAGNSWTWAGTTFLGWANMWSLVGTLAAIIHELDPYHPVATCTPNINADVMYNGFMRYANTLDFFGANVYGAAATGFVSKVAGINGCTGWARPFFASEFGMTNWFNAPYTGATTATGASALSTYLEDTSTTKARTYAAAYAAFVGGASLGNAIAPLPAGAAPGGAGGLFLGCYAFQYGWIWQATATWVNLLNFYSYTFLAAAGGYDGAGSTMPGAWAMGNEDTEPMDTLSAMFSTTAPVHTAPTINAALGILLNGQTGPQNINLQAGKNYSAYINASDTNAIPSVLGYQWMLLPIPSGGPTDHTTYAPIGVGAPTPFFFTDAAGHAGFTAPTAAGQYRLAVWVYNGWSKFAYHNVPFTVSAGLSAYTFGVTADTYVQGPATTSSVPTNYASAQNVFGSSPTLLGNAFANTKNVTYVPYLYFNFSASAFSPDVNNLPTQASLVVYSVGGTMPYYNLSVYPVQSATLGSWNNGLSFSALQPSLASTGYTYNAAYNWPWSPGWGGATNCPALPNTPAGITACKPLVRAVVTMRAHPLKGCLSLPVCLHVCLSACLLVLC